MIRYCTEGISEVIRTINRFDEDIVLEVIDYLNRMMNNFSLKKFRKFEASAVVWVEIVE